MTYLKEQLIKEISNSLDMTSEQFKSVLVGSTNAQNLLFKSANIDLLANYRTVKELAIDVVTLTFPTNLRLPLIEKVKKCDHLDCPLTSLLG